MFGFAQTDRGTAIGGSSIVSNYPQMLSRSSFVAVHTNIPTMRNSSIDNLYGQKFVTSDILLKLPVNVQPMDNIVYQSGSADGPYSFHTSVSHLSELNLYLTDEFNQALTPQYDWSLTLRIEYEKNYEPSEKSNSLLSKIADSMQLMTLNI